VWGKELSRGWGSRDILSKSISILYYSTRGPSPWVETPLFPPTAMDIHTISDVHSIEYSLKIETYQTAVLVCIYKKIKKPS
jgi:hypothetical protein